MQRRSFFRLAGASAGTAALALAGCHRKDDTSTTPRDLGSGDTGALNYLYVLEEVVTQFGELTGSGNYFAALSPKSAEYLLLRDILQHHRTHVDILRTELGSNTTTGLSYDFSSVSFADRLTVDSTRTGNLNALQTLLDLAVGAYNGAGRYFITANYVTLAAKMSSVTARHAALVRDLLVAGGNASLGQGFVGPDVITASTTGAGARLERALTPAMVLPQLNVFLTITSQLTAPSLA